MIKNWSVGTKLLVSFIVVALFAAAIGVVSFVSLNNVSRLADDISEQSVPSIELFRRFNTLSSTQRRRSARWSSMMWSTKATRTRRKASLKAKLAKAIALTDKQIAAMDGLSQNKDEQTSFADQDRLGFMETAQPEVHEGHQHERLPGRLRRQLRRRA